MKKYIVLILSLVLIIACKNDSITGNDNINKDNEANTNPLENKSGIWIGTRAESKATMTITFDKDGNGTYASNVDHSTNNPHTIKLIKVNDSVYTFSLQNYTEDFKITFNNDNNGILDTPNSGYSKAQFILNKQN